MRNLGIDARWVLFGHTHRTGPRERDDPSEWGVLMNTGSWVHEDAFLGGSGSDSPYWPGSAVELESDPAHPPRLVRLLASWRRPA